MARRIRRVPDKELRLLAAHAQHEKGAMLEELAKLPQREKEQLVEWADDLANRNTEDAASLAILVKLIHESSACAALAKQAKDRIDAPIKHEASKPPPMVILGTVVLGNVRRHEMRTQHKKPKSPYGQTWATPRKQKK